MPTQKRTPINSDANKSPDEILLDELKGTADDTINSTTPPSSLGDVSISGDMPDLQSDDNTLDNEHAVGLRLDEDEENPRPLNIAGDVMAAEKRRRGY
jgi:hypothetical protein